MRDARYLPRIRNAKDLHRSEAYANHTAALLIRFPPRNPKTRSTVQSIFTRIEREMCTQSRAREMRIARQDPAESRNLRKSRTLPPRNTGIKIPKSRSFPSSEPCFRARVPWAGSAKYGMEKQQNIFHTTCRSDQTFVFMPGPRYIFEILLRQGEVLFPRGRA